MVNLRACFVFETLCPSITATTIRHNRLVRSSARTYGLIVRITFAQRWSRSYYQVDNDQKRLVVGFDVSFFPQIPPVIISVGCYRYQAGTRTEIIEIVYTFHINRPGRVVWQKSFAKTNISHFAVNACLSLFHVSSSIEGSISRIFKNTNVCFFIETVLKYVLFTNSVRTYLDKFI